MPKTTVASYCTTFLKPEMLHIYRQVTGLDRWATFVVAKDRREEGRYPFEDVEVPPAVKSNFMRRFWMKYIKKEPPIVYRGEYGALAGVLGRRDADLLHIYFGHTGVHLLPFIRRWPKPVVVSFHGADVRPRADRPGYLDDLKQLLVELPLVMARSESLKARLMDLGCAEEKIRINRTGIPMDAFPVVEREFPGDGNWHFVQACRLIEKKGLRTAFKAFARFAKERAGARFTIAGVGPMQGELEELAGELGVAGKIEFVGFLSEAELGELFASAHAFVHPSQVTEEQDQEGVPNAMLEAMATGLPVLATKHGGIPEAVDDKKAGLLVEERDDVGVAAAMESLAADETLWRALGNSAAVDVRMRFGQAEQIANLERIYDEAVLIHEGKENGV